VVWWNESVQVIDGAEERHSAGWNDEHSGVFLHARVGVGVASDGGVALLLGSEVIEE
jgi:hypothetical protein